MALPIIPLLTRRAERTIAAHFETAGATDRAHAIAFTPGPRRVERQLFAQLVRFGAVVETTRGHYWLDTKRLAGFRKETLAHVIGVIGIAGLAAAAAMALGR